MPLAERALLLSVVLASCALLPATMGRYSGRRKESDSVDSDLIEMLKKLREKLNGEKAADELESMYQRDSTKKINLKSDGDLTEEQQQQLVDAINSKRSSQGASNMYKLYWNNELAKKAQEWVNQCQYKLGVEPFSADEVGFLILGQTLATFDTSFDANQIVEKWFSDSAAFDPDTQQCALNQPCGAKTQLVYATTTDVGCAVRQCDSVAGQSNANFLVCYYGPAASYDEVPFASGSPCTMCQHGQFYCNNGLCDLTCSSAGPECECKAECKNGATETSDCACKCKPGLSGVNCADECKDFHERCDPKNKKSWKQAQCSSDFPFVPRLCPKMCGLCESEGNPGGRSRPDRPPGLPGLYLEILEID